MLRYDAVIVQSHMPPATALEGVEDVIALDLRVAHELSQIR